MILGLITSLWNNLVEYMEYNVAFMVDRKDTAYNDLAPIFDNYEWWLDLAHRDLIYSNLLEENVL